jgi:hypothetical protein
MAATVFAGATLLTASTALAAYPAYQWVKSLTGNTYYSCKKFKSHEGEGQAAQWVGRMVARMNLGGTALRSTGTIKTKQTPCQP